MVPANPPRLPRRLIAALALLLVALWIVVPLGIVHLLRAAHEPLRERIVDGRVVERELFASDGQRLLVEHFDAAGRRHGSHQAWAADGRPLFRQHYRHGQPIGVWSSWIGDQRVDLHHRDGRPVAKWRYRDGHRHGRATEWDASGSVRAVTWWREGRPVTTPVL